MTGGPMPYILDKGPYFSVFESRLADRATRRQILLDLRNPNVYLSALAGFDSTSLAKDGLNRDGRVAVLNQGWFGMQPSQSGHWAKQPAVIPTGFWIGYQGDPEAILRDALTRSIEVSLDLAPGQDPPANAGAQSRFWPIDIYWICQGPWFQCWILWRAADNAEGGHVSLVIATPAAGGYPLKSRITRDPPTDPGYASPPPAGSRNDAHGMWVVGHEDYQKVITYATIGTLLGEITFPSVNWCPTNINKVVCVAPAEWEGGVLPDGRLYQPPGP
jgi:hypothetical protein